MGALHWWLMMALVQNKDSSGNKPRKQFSLPFLCIVNILFEKNMLENEGKIQVPSKPLSYINPMTIKARLL